MSPIGHLPRLLCTMGMTPLDVPPPANSRDCYTVVLNGQVVGQVERELAKPLADRLRMLKVMREEKVIVGFGGHQCLTILFDIFSQCKTRKKMYTVAGSVPALTLSCFFFFLFYFFYLPTMEASLVFTTFRTPI